MHREIKIFRFIVLALFISAVGVALYSLRIAFAAHLHRRELTMQLVALFVTGFFVLLSALPAWLSYLLFFRFLTAVEISGVGYILQTRAPHREHAEQLRAVRKVGYLDGPNELTVVRSDGKYWVCLSAMSTNLFAARNDGFGAPNRGV